MRIRRRRSSEVQTTCKEGTCSQTCDNSLNMEGGLGQDDGMATPLFGDIELGRMDRRSLQYISFAAGYEYPPLEMVQLRGSWGRCGQRKYRKKNTSSKAAETSYLFGFLKHFVSGDVNFGTRKNYSHWTSDEVEALLNGVEEHGVGNWALIKRTYFKTFPRTAEHLKDKWRGLCRACGLQVGSKQKVKAQPATLEILKGFTYKIREMARKHDA
ncbi:unnamed protein product [Urochloa decumbens]|uniref:Myb-like domain-containing protein n=1 Tax=Urochloa decumbens TaxID=240449 RepID=A0ABC8Y078_9POAL